MQGQYPPQPGYPGMPPQFPSVPSAHLESHGQRQNCPNGQIITHWNPNDPKSHVLGGFSYNNAGGLTVPFTGRYYVYAQLFFVHQPSPSKNRVLVMAGNRVLLMINKDLPGGPIEETGSAGGVFLLHAGEQISLKPDRNDTSMWFHPEHCYFGAYMMQGQYPPQPGYPGMPPQLPSVPSAHLESHGQRKNCRNGQIITHWNPNDPKSHVLGGFYYNNAGALTVPYTGRYYVYAQLFFVHQPSLSKNRVLVMAGNRVLLMINKDLPGGPIEETGSAGGVFVLSAGEQISLKPDRNDTSMWFHPEHCYFGAHMVSA